MFSDLQAERAGSRRERIEPRAGAHADILAPESNTGSGTADRLNRLFANLTPAQALAMARGVRDHGPANNAIRAAALCPGPVSIALRPRLVPVACRNHVHHVSLQVRRGLRRLAHVRAMDLHAREILPLSEAESAFMARHRRAENLPALHDGVFCRLDGVVRFEGKGWRSTLKFVEPNVVAPRGIGLAPAVEQAMVDHVVGPLRTLGGEPSLGPNHDPRELLLAELLCSARERSHAEQPVIGLLADRSRDASSGDARELEAYFRSRGAAAMLVDPRELTLGKCGVVMAQGKELAVIYRFLSIQDLLALEEGGADLSALHAAFDGRCVLPSPAGDLEQRSTFEIFTSSEFRAWFSLAERVVFDEHVLWTRLLTERRTEDPTGHRVDLFDYARANRERLVIKPNRGSGSAGVVLGEAASEAAWMEALNRAASNPGSSVVQLAAPADVELFPEVSAEGAVTFEAKHAVTSFFPGSHGLGMLGVLSPRRIVSLAGGESIAPFLLHA